MKSLPDWAISSQGLMKTCTKCGEQKPLSEFSVRNTNNGKASKPYPSPHCKSCGAAKTRLWNEQHRDDAYRAVCNARAKAKRARIKDAVFAAYGGYRCACCGECERAFLTLDHVNNDGAAMRRAQFGARQYAGYRTYAWLVKHGFPEGYQVLCMNCNHGKRMNHGVCPHQARSNDQPLAGVEPSGSKRTASVLRMVHGR